MALSGATTMWETWDGSASRNHPPFCLISAYFYKYLAGIRCDRAYPGFERFTVDPSVVGDLTFVEACTTRLTAVSAANGGATAPV